jgi:hypothetical protein
MYQCYICTVLAVLAGSEKNVVLAVLATLEKKLSSKKAKGSKCLYFVTKSEDLQRFKPKNKKKYRRQHCSCRAAIDFTPT